MCTFRFCPKIIKKISLKDLHTYKIICLRFYVMYFGSFNVVKHTYGIVV